MQVADVQKRPISVARVINAGHRVVFGHILHLESGQNTLPTGRECQPTRSHDVGHSDGVHTAGKVNRTAGLLPCRSIGTRGHEGQEEGMEPEREMELEVEVNVNGEGGFQELFGILNCLLRQRWRAHNAT